MKDWPNWLKHTIVWTFYIVALLLFFHYGITKILGVPFAVVAYALQRSFGITID